VPQAAAEHRTDEPIERAIEAAAWIVAAVELRQRERALGQRLEHEKASALALRQRIDHRAGRIRPIARKPGTCTDMHRRGHPLTVSAGDAIDRYS
jgi:hypothetical protein